MLLLLTALVFIFYCEDKNTAQSELAKNENSVAGAKPLHSIEFRDKKVIVDNFWIVMSFRANSLNCEIFEYLNTNREREVSVSELEEHVFRGRNVDFAKIVDSLGVRGDLKKILFTFDSGKITYHPDAINQQKEVKIN